MLYRTSFVFLLFSSVLTESYSQSCNCLTQLNYTIQKIETNYAGFADKVTDATKEKYNEHTQRFKNKTAVEKNADSCLKRIREWTGFFRDGHIQLGKQTNPAAPVTTKPAAALSERYYFKRIDGQTNLIRIASFNHTYKTVIDSIIKANYAAITSAKYLLLDLRGNGGGSDVSYSELIPFIYTNPISVVGASRLSTPDNIAKYEAIVSDTNYPPSSRESAQLTVDRLSAIPGKFLEGSSDTLRLKDVLPYPALVGIIIDRKCASTTEQFLLAAKQSKKTVFFGENSGGVLDYANMHFLDLPCYDWKLGYATSRSMRLPGSPIDNIGIAPDVRINNEEKDWVRFASDYLKQVPVVQLGSYNYTDTAQVEMQRLANDIAGNAATTFDKVRNIIWWTNKNFFWAFTDYQRRTTKQVICRQGGNCNEQAVVVRALLKELNVKTRRTSEINIQPENERRQKDAEKRIGETGNKGSVFGYRHNDHVWIEFFDEESRQWIPADPTLGLAGLENWIKSRIGFEPRVNHAIVASADMLVPIAVFALNPDGTIAENRSEYYLIESFNRVYKDQLVSLPSWKSWKEAVDFIQQKSRDAFEGKDNLHRYTDQIQQLKEIYEKLKEQYVQNASRHGF
jgi:transglutaminase-like putative cysteine protease